MAVVLYYYVTLKDIIREYWYLFLIPILHMTHWRAFRKVEMERSSI